MLTIHDFFASPAGHDKMIQMALREIDTRDLSYVMIGLGDEDAQRIFFNMSKRAAELLKEEIESVRVGAPPYRIKQATEFFLQQLVKHGKYTDGEQLEELLKWSVDEQRELPSISTRDEKDILDAFLTIQKYAREHGVLALQGIDQKIEDPVMRRGIQFYIDGWDPMLIQTIMEKHRTAYIRRMENRLDMILEGLDSLTSGDLSLATEERLKTFLY